MKKLIYISLLAALTLGSCTDMLMEDNKVKVTTEFIYTTDEGIYRGMVALYYLERAFVTDGDQSATAITCMLDGATDILMYRGGGDSPTLCNENLKPDNGVIATFWKQRYVMIGRCNEIIDAAENRLGLDNQIVKTAWGAAKLFRARCYFDLVRRFDNIYLNTRPTTIGNLERTYQPASQSDVFTFINEDLDDAIEALNWTPSQVGSTILYGEMTKATAKHVKAQVAIWNKDWDTAITQVDDIFARTEYGMMPSAIECFQGANLNCKEVLYSYQFSNLTSGGGKMSTEATPKWMGHRMAPMTNNDLRNIDGMSQAVEYGCFGWGRIYPNTYLLGLYDQSKDKRYTELFHYWQQYKYNNPTGLPPGKSIGMPFDKSLHPSVDFLTRLHPMSMKYFDKWTNTDPTYTSSYKDIVVYRLAETALMGAEAYMMKHGGTHAKALEYYNMTWERAGNDPETNVTIEKLLDENARELNMEGTRFYMLKRLGIYVAQTVRYGGNTKEENPDLASSSIKVRTATKAKNITWPIPEAELDMMNSTNMIVAQKLGITIPPYPQNQDW